MLSAVCVSGYNVQMPAVIVHPVGLAIDSGWRTNEVL